MATDSAELRSAVSASQAARFGRDAGAASKRQAKGRERAELSAQLDHARGVVERRLDAFEAELLEQAPIVGDRDAPLVIVKGAGKPPKARRAPS